MVWWGPRIVLTAAQQLSNRELGLESIPIRTPSGPDEAAVPPRKKTQRLVARWSARLMWVRSSPTNGGFAGLGNFPRHDVRIATRFPLNQPSPLKAAERSISDGERFR